jgi:hypothetical protein
MAPRTNSQAPGKPEWTPNQTYHALQKQLAALDQLRGQDYRKLKYEEGGWSALTANIIQRGFVAGSGNIAQFNRAKNSGFYYPGMGDGDYQDNFSSRIKVFDAVLKASISELELMGAGNNPTGTASAPAVPMEVTSGSRNVFLVHGHDEAVTSSVARFLESLDLKPIILHEQPNQGQTIIEKFERHPAWILLSCC